MKKVITTWVLLGLLPSGWFGGMIAKADYSNTDFVLDVGPFTNLGTTTIYATRPAYTLDDLNSLLGQFGKNLGQPQTFYNTAFPNPDVYLSPNGDLTNALVRARRLGYPVPSAEQIVVKSMKDGGLLVPEGGNQRRTPPASPGHDEKRGLLGSIGRSISDPVDVISGAFTDDEVDLRVAGPMPFEVRRTYSSTAFFSESDFGFGWKPCVANLLYEPTVSNRFIVTSQDGSVVIYSKDIANNRWRPVSSENPGLNNEEVANPGVLKKNYQAQITPTTETIEQSVYDAKKRVYVTQTVQVAMYILQASDGSKTYFFNPTNIWQQFNPVLHANVGSVFKKVDARGNWQRFTYDYTNNNGVLGQYYGKLIRVDTSNGKSVTFNYGGFSGWIRVASVTTDDGRGVYYDYDLEGDLKKVTRLDGSVVNYDYFHQKVPYVAPTPAGSNVMGTPIAYAPTRTRDADGNMDKSLHLLTRVTRPEGRLLENDFDGTGRVITQRATVGDNGMLVVNARYTYMQTTGDNGVAGNTKVTSDNGTDYAATYEYTDSRLTKLADPLGRVVTQEWYGIGETASGAYPGSLKKKTETSGLVTEYRYDGNGNLTEVKRTGRLTASSEGTTSATTSYAYDGTNRLIRTTDPVGGVTEYTYGDGARPYDTTRIEIKTGGTSLWVGTMAYADTGALAPAPLTGALPAPFAAGLLSRSVIAEGTSAQAVTTYSYNSAGFMTGSTKETGTGDPSVTTTYVPDTRGRIMETRDSLNRKMSYTYDNWDRLATEEVFNSDGGRLSKTGKGYNGNGELIFLDGPRAGIEDYTWIEYDKAGNLTKTTVQRSRAKGDKSGVEKSDGAVSTAKYDMYANLTQSTDSRGNATMMTYDKAGRMKTRQRYQGGEGGTVLTSEAWSYTPTSTDYTDVLNNHTIETFSDDGKLLSLTMPDGVKFDWIYALDGRVTREPVDAATYQEFSYDDTNRKVTITLKDVTGASVATTTKVHDAQGRVISETDAAGYVWTTSYDALGRIKRKAGPPTVADSAQHIETFTYDGGGLLTIVKDEATGETTETSTDTLRRVALVRIKSEGGTVVRTTSYANSSDGQSMTQTDGTGGAAISTTTYFDYEGHPVLIAKGDGGKVSVTYDAAGNVTAISDEKNRVTSYAYDSLNRSTQETLPGGAQTTFTYNAEGDLLTRVMPAGRTWKAIYDRLGRLTEELLKNDATYFHNSDYTYNLTGPSAGLLATKTSPDGSRFSYSYDNRRRLKRVVVDEDSIPPTSIVDYDYDVFGRITAATRTITDYLGGRNSKVERSYDGYGRMLTETIGIGSPLTTLSSLKMAWDGAGRRISLERIPETFDEELDPVLYEYEYRGDGLLSKVSYNGNEYAFSYADNGLLTGRTNPRRSIAITRDGVGRVASRSTTATVSGKTREESVTWNSDGTMATYSGVGGAAVTFTYDDRRRLLSEGVRSVPSAGLSYGFDNGVPGLGLRTSAATSGYAPSWGRNVATKDRFGMVRTETVNDGDQLRTVTVNGTAQGADYVQIAIDYGDLQSVTYQGPSDPTGAWSATVSAQEGEHTLIVYATVDGDTTTATSKFMVQPAQTTITDLYNNAGNLEVVVVRAATALPNSRPAKSREIIYGPYGELTKIYEYNGAYNGFEWSATYDAFGRRLLTSERQVSSRVLGNVIFGTSSVFDPLVEFLELGVTIQNNQAWKVYGPDTDGTYGGMQGVGGLEALYYKYADNHVADNVWGDIDSIVLSSGFSRLLSLGLGAPAVEATSYGPLQGRKPLPLQNGNYAQPGGWRIYLGTLAWRGRSLDSTTGLHWLGERYYDGNSGRFLSPDPLGVESDMSLHALANGDPVNNFDPTGRIASGFWEGYQHPNYIAADASNTATANFFRVIGAGLNGADEGVALGAKANVNAASSTVVSLVTLGNLPSVQPWAVNAQDLNNGYATSYGFARVGWGSAAAALTAGGSTYFQAGSTGAQIMQSVQVLETGGAVAGIGRAGIDMYDHGLNWSNGVEMAANGLGAVGGVSGLKTSMATSAKAVAVESNFVNLANPQRTTHILTGNATGGGHLFPGGAGKSPFPQSWSADKVMHHISDVATDPASILSVGRGGRSIATGTREGINITVVLDSQKKGGGIVTGFPTNVPRNP